MITLICVNISGKYDESDHKLTATRVLTHSDQASDRYYLCWMWYHTLLWGDSSCDIPKHHDDEDSHLRVSILQVMSLPWADFTLVQHQWQIDLDHPSCYNDQASWVSLTLNRCHRHHWFQQYRGCISNKWNQIWNLSTNWSSKCKSDKCHLVTMLTLSFLGSSLCKFWPINFLWVFFWSRDLYWKSASSKG